MAKIDCPGSETWEKMYGLEGRGISPLSAIINAFLQLILLLAQARDLAEFLEKECDGECWQRVIGPEFERFSGTLEIRHDGSWKYFLHTKIKFHIQCSNLYGPISNEELMDEIGMELDKLNKST